MSSVASVPSGDEARDAEVGLGWGEPAAPAEGGSGEPLLGRAEMAALLQGEAGEARAAILATLGARRVAQERWPTFERVLERFREFLQASLREWCAGEVELSLESIGARRFGEHLESLPRPIPIAVLRLTEGDGRALLIPERALAFALVDLLLGGRRAGTGNLAEARALTSIERALIERFVGLVLADLERAFAPVAAVRFTLERIETDPRFASVTRPTNACFLVKFRIALEGRSGTLVLLVPYATLEPFRDRLREPVTGERFGSDPIWERHWASRIRVTEVELEAVLDERPTTLREIAALRVGEVLPLSAEPDSPVVLRCAGVPLLSGRLGRVGERVSVRIEDRIPREQED